MSESEAEESSDYAAFAILVYEFSSDAPVQTDRKIKNALRRKHLGAYDAVRVERLRALKNELQQELRSGRASRFFTGPTAQFGSPEDWNQAALTEDLRHRYPEFTASDLGRMVSIALYVDYLR